MNLFSKTANRTWIAACLLEEARYIRALRSPEVTQGRLLKNILQRNERCELGRRFGFERMDKVDDFREQVPLSSYSDYEQLVGESMQGAANLVSEEVIRTFVPTGGSTGHAKFIPHTASLLREIRRGIAPWIVDMHRTYPSLRKGSAYWSISPSTGRDDRPDDTTYLGGLLSRIVRQTLAVPPQAVAGLEGDDFWVMTLSLLLGREDLAFVSVWHPSFLEQLLDQLERHWDRLITMQRTRRAHALLSADPTKVLSVWPGLRLVSCWGDAHAEHACRSLSGRIAGTPIQPKGLLATEAIVSIPFARKHPLALRSHFFEFLDSCGRSHLAHDLSEGEVYRVCVTTSGGLYRYQMFDEVIVDGFVEATPSIRFLGKTDSFCDLVGEKLTEAFVASCLERVFEKGDMCTRFAILAPDAGKPGYTLYLEADHAPKRLGHDLDERLRENPQYDHARALGQLAPVKVSRIERGGYATYTRRLTRMGKRIGEIKPSALRKERDWDQWLQPCSVSDKEAIHS